MIITVLVTGLLFDIAHARTSHKRISTPLNKRKINKFTLVYSLPCPTKYILNECSFY